MTPKLINIVNVPPMIVFALGHQAKIVTTKGSTEKNAGLNLAFIV